MAYSGKVNIQQAIDDSPFSRFHWVIIVLGFLVLAIDGFDTAAMGYIAPTLSADWGIKKHWFTFLYAFPISTYNSPSSYR